jgi:uncharacterized protein
VSQSNSGYVSNRVLKINVGFLLSGGPGHSHTTTFDVPTVKIADDLTVDYIRGPIRLSRTAEGILVQGQLQLGIAGECYRCLDTVTQDVTLNIEELFAYPSPTVAEFSLHDDGILDLAPLLRAEVLIVNSRRFLCRPDCKGLCPECGVNWNQTTCTCAEEAIDLRLAGFKKFLE